ncbi:hypothetical protein Esti_006024 [Eimeria stiedai]
MMRYGSSSSSSGSGVGEGSSNRNSSNDSRNSLFGEETAGSASAGMASDASSGHATLYSSNSSASSRRSSRSSRRGSSSSSVHSGSSLDRSQYSDETHDESSREASLGRPLEGEGHEGTPEEGAPLRVAMTDHLVGAAAAAVAAAASRLPLPAAAQQSLRQLSMGFAGGSEGAPPGGEGGPPSRGPRGGAPGASSRGDDSAEGESQSEGEEEWGIYGGRRGLQRAEREKGPPGGKRKGRPRSGFEHLPTGCLHVVFRFLLAKEILQASGVCTAWSEAVHGCIGAFTGVTSVCLDENWLRLEGLRRQQVLLQLQRLQQLEVRSAAFKKGGLTLKEVAAVVARNANTLQKLSLFSPASFLDDRSPAHAPFSFRPLRFPFLRCMYTSGCQSMEWMHVFCNCEFPRVEVFEVTYFPPPIDHWSWKNAPDFTALGLRGLQRTLNQMPSLRRLTLGLELLADGQLEGGLERASSSSRSSGSRLARGSSSRGVRDRGRRVVSLGDGWSYEAAQNAAEEEGPPADEALGGPQAWTVHPPAGAEEAGGPEPLGGRSPGRPYRGRFTEANLSDIFAIACVRAGSTGCLKKIALLQKEEQPLPPELEDEEGGEDRAERPVVTTNTLSEFVSGAASFCARYVSEVFGSVSEEG